MHFRDLSSKKSAADVSTLLGYGFRQARRLHPRNREQMRRHPGIEQGLSCACPTKRRASANRTHDINRSSPMTSRLRSACAALMGVGLAAGAVAVATPATAQTKLKLVLNWKYQGPQGMFFLADDRGYYKAERLEVTLDQGNGSGAAVPLVANGTYD